MTAKEKLLYYNTPKTNAEEQIEKLRIKEIFHLYDFLNCYFIQVCIA